MLTSLLAAFRQQYPTGSVVSDLLAMPNGLFVVRAVITVDGRTLSTGLAAQKTLEVAEDSACERALSRLALPGLASPPAATKLPGLASPPAVTKLTMATPPVLQAEEPSDHEVGTETSLIVEPVLVDAAATSFPLEPSLPEPDLLYAEDMAINPVDLSDIIAQTDVELQRLGWGVSQGRDFLEKTYGKRSRHDLTDEELLEFLLYLETQTVPEL